MSNNKKKKQKMSTDEVVRIGLKKSVGFTGGLLVNVIIVYLVIRVFAFSFDFTYSIFGDVAKDPTAKEYVVIDIPADSSVKEISQALEDGGVIDNKYAFMVKVKIKDYGAKIIPGKYGLSPSMTYQEILDVICNIHE